MQVFGLMIVRNEADIVRVNLLHHLALGIDQFLIIDNGSSDNTPEILEELSRDTGRVHWRSDPGPFREAEMRTELARRAFEAQADWVVPTDADEFWYAPHGGLRHVLEGTRASVLRAHLVNFVQRRDRLDALPEALLDMTRRPSVPTGTLEQARELVERRQIANVENLTQPKQISRPSASIMIAEGNHVVTGVSGFQEQTDKLVCLHASLRARSVLEAKLVDNQNWERGLGANPHIAWHWRRWRRLWEQGQLEEEWRANSYENDCLDVYGVPHHLVYDPRLRDIVAPWIDQPPGRVLVGRETPPPRSEMGAAEEANTESAREERAALLLTVHDQYCDHLRAVEQSRDFWRAELSTRESERDAVIRGLQAELHEKVGEANRVIAELQAELHEKLGEANGVIAELQAEHQTKIDEREQTIHDLRAELHEKVGEANSVIAEQQAELHEKVGEANVIIRDLQAQLAAARNASAQPTPVEDIPSEHAAELAEETLAEHDRAIRTLEAEVSALQRSRAWRVVGTYYGLRELLRAVPVRLRRAGRGR